MIDFLLILIYAMLAVAAALTTWSVLWGLLRNRGEARQWGVPVRLVSRIVGLGLLGLLVLTFALADVSPLAVNGHTFADAFWLRTADMLINSSLALIAVAMLGMLFGVAGVGRRLKH